MSALPVSIRAEPDATSSSRLSRLFVLEVSGNRIHAMSPDGTDDWVIVAGCRTPDGIAGAGLPDGGRHGNRDNHPFGRTVNGA